jgi:esterase/lipase superfamily enzyme
VCRLAWRFGFDNPGALIRLVVVTDSPAYKAVGMTDASTRLQIERRGVPIGRASCFGWIFNRPLRLLIRGSRPAPALLFAWSPVLMLCACTGGEVVREIDLMPPPGVYEDAAIDPYLDTDPVANFPQASVLYATLRAPAEVGDTQSDGGDFYTNEWDQVLRVGVAKIEAGQNDLSWEEARRISLLKNRSIDYPLSVADVEEFGPLGSLRSPFADPALFGPNPMEPDDRFAAEINRKLAQSRSKDVFIYVHGFKVGFENPVLVTAELWHFLAYEGVAIAFSWPSNRGLLSYFRDTEGSVLASFAFRRFLEYLAKETDAQRLHVISYSAGTRLAGATIGQLALRYHHLDSATTRDRLRIGNFIMIGGDVDRGVVGGYIFDGALKIPEQMTIYVSETDGALDLSQRIFSGRFRLGQTTKSNLPGYATEFIRQQDNLTIIDVTDAEESNTGNGHHYFRQSPWVSSDILTSLAYGLNPSQRGLVRDEGSPIWHFPSDYLARLRSAILKVNPALAEP